VVLESVPPNTTMACNPAQVTSHSAAVQSDLDDVSRGR